MTDEYKIDNEILDPLYDEVFKKLFGSEPNEQITIQFIRDITKIPVTEVTFLDPFVDIDVYQLSKRVVDVLCKSSNGDSFLIEIQRASQLHFRRRILFYAAKIFTGPLKVGDRDYSKLKSTVVIAISGNYLSFKNPSYFSKHEFVDKHTGECEIDGIQIITLDLSKFMKQNVAELLDSTDAWCFLLKYVYLAAGKDIHALEKKYPTMQQALQELRTFKLSPEEYERYLVYKMTQYDTSETDPEDVAIRAAKRARMKGRMEGRMEAGMEIARSMLSSGLRTFEPMKTTGDRNIDAIIISF